MPTVVNVGETSKDIDVILYIDGTPYTYTVTADR